MNSEIKMNSEIEHPKSEIKINLLTANTLYQQIAQSTCGTEVKMLAKLYHGLRPYLNSQQAKN